MIFMSAVFLEVLGIGRRAAVVGKAAPEIKTASREPSR